MAHKKAVFQTRVPRSASRPKTRRRSVDEIV